VRRRPHHDDARAKSITLTARGGRLLDAVEAIYTELEVGWADVVGAAAVEQVRSTLERIVASGHAGRLPDVRPT
jgi:DNA-binding MarR family transcriptional regulator